MGDLGSIPGLERSPGEGNGSPLQYRCLENPMDRGAWQAAVLGVAKSWTLSPYMWWLKKKLFLLKSVFIIVPGIYLVVVIIVIITGIFIVCQVLMQTPSAYLLIYY